MNKVERFGMFELVLNGKEPARSHVEVDCLAIFTNGDQQVRIKGFYNGNSEYRVRFMPQERGIWSYKIHSSLVEPIDGEFECIENTGSNHGPVIAKEMHFQYADGTKYIPFGTTCYAWTHQPGALVELTKKTLSKSPFNKIRMGVFPKSLVYNNNDPERYPFEKNAEGHWDVHRPDFVFWTNLENQLQALMDMGIEADLILFHPYDRWGFAKMKREDDLVYLDYCIRRLSSFRNLWWSLANEYDTVFDKALEDWDIFGNFIDREDPYHHLLSIHHCVLIYDFKKPWVTHCSIQSSFVHKTEAWRNEYQKPVIIDECGYEGDVEESWGNLSAFELVHRYWAVIAKGGFCTHGETYHREDEVLWWAKGGELRGESVKRIAFLKEIVYGLEGEIQPVKGKFYHSRNEVQSSDDPEISNNPSVKEFYMRFSPIDWEYYVMSLTTYVGRIDQNCYIHYLGKSCQSVCTLDLPEETEYSIDLIDIWEMTRETVIPKASGKIKVCLPGKKGTAVIATRV